MGRLLNRVQSKRKVNCSSCKWDWQVIDLVEKLQWERRLKKAAQKERGRTACAVQPVGTSLLLCSYFILAILLVAFKAFVVRPNSRKAAATVDQQCGRAG